jgi:hypothetical protein
MQRPGDFTAAFIPVSIAITIALAVSREDRWPHKKLQVQCFAIGAVHTCLTINPECRKAVSHQKEGMVIGNVIKTLMATFRSLFDPSHAPFDRMT